MATVIAFIIGVFVWVPVYAADPPTVTGILPSSASNTGGDTVTITGTGFQAGATVKLGFTQASNATFVNNTTLQVTVPTSYEAGMVDVTVTNSDGQSGALPGGFTYFPPAPILTSLSPNQGKTSGGENVTITGSGFYKGIRFSVIEAGTDYACGIAAGKVYCWGLNNYGQLGDGTLTKSLNPVTVDDSGVLAGKRIVALAAGTGHTVALSSEGKLYSWGMGGYGQLGNNSLVNSGLPVEVDMTGVLAGKTISKISAGDGHTLAITSDGLLFAWGLNNEGQLGDTTQTTRRVPAAVNMTGVLAGKAIVSIDASLRHSLAIDSNGKAYAWGHNGYGQLGDGTTTGRNSPVAVLASGVLSGKTLMDIKGGPYHTVAIDSNGKAYAWGYNAYGQLGNNTQTSSYAPVVTNATGVLSGKVLTKISAGDYFTIAADSEGTLYGWGQNNVWAQLANPGAGTFATSPVLVNMNGSLTNKSVTSLSSGANFSVVSSSTGEGYAWGRNSDGQLGNGNPVNVQSQLTQVIGQSPRNISVSMGGALADVTSQTTNSLTFTAPAHAAGLIDVSLIEDGAATSALANSYEYIAPPTVTSVTPGSAYNSGGDTITISGAAFRPGATLKLGLISNISTSYVNSTTLQAIVPTSAETGTVGVTVTNTDGQKSTLPGGFTYIQPPPTISSVTPDVGPVSGGQNVTLSGSGFMADLAFTKISSGTTHTCGIYSGKAYCWGQNNYGQLGNNSTTDSLVPVAVDTTGVLAGKTLTAISAGPARTVAVDSDGKAYGWGVNNYGQLGNNSTTDSLVPVAVDTTGVLAGKKLTAISTGSNHTVALDTDGKAYGWGQSGNGQLGNGAVTTSLVPVATNTSGILTGKTLTSISAGYYHTVALDSDGKAYGWGNNQYGQLGNGSTGVTNANPVATNASGVLAGKKLTTISAGMNHTVALDSDGKAYGWGEGMYGQLGNNSTTATNANPVATNASGVLAGKTLTTISAGINHTVALDSDGKAYGWGRNSNGSLGDNSVTQRTFPVATNAGSVLAGKTLTTISAGNDFTVALDSDGKAYGWGLNSRGQLGNNSTTRSLVPVSTVTRIPLPLSVSIGGDDAVITEQTPSSLSFTTPVHAPGLVDITLTSPLFSSVTKTNAYEYLAPPIISVVSPVSGSTSGGDAITVSGSDFRSGAVVYFNETPAETTYINSTTLSAVTPVATGAGPANVRVVSADGQSDALVKAYTFTAGSPIISSVEPSFGPAGGGTNVTVKGAGFTTQARFRAIGTPGGGMIRHNCAITENGKVYCWGHGGNGAMGNGNNGGVWTKPVATDMTGVLAGKTITSIAVGAYFTLALDSEGKVYSWGYNNHGQLGDGGVSTRTTPVAVNASGALDGKTVVAIAAGDNFSLALDSEGKLYSWGYNYYGTLGNGTKTSSSTPVEVTATGALTDKKIVAIAAATRHVLALDSNGSVYAWGDNPYGQLGDGTTVQRLSPVAVDISGALAGKTITSISAGLYQSAALDSSGKVYTWGNNTSGQLGDGTTSHRYSPVDISENGMLSGSSIAQISVGYTSMLALGHNEQLYTWGENRYGVFGTSAGNQEPFAVADPIRVEVNVPIQALAVASHYSCILAYDGNPYCAGLNDYGQLGDGTTSNRFTFGITSRTNVTTESVVQGLAIGGLSTTVTGATSTMLNFTTPAHDPGLVDITLASSSFGSVTKTDAYEYLAPPTLATVSPSSGVKTGGDTVTIVGSNFSSNPTVTFGGVAATSVVRVSSTTITATAPAHAIGVVDVVVANSDGQSSTLTDSFTYTESEPEVANVTPSTGPVAGQQEVTITGVNFVTGGAGELPTVTFGGIVATDVIVVSSTKITAKTPAGTSGLVDVAVTNYDGKTANLVSGYEYLPPPILTSISPSEGSTVGGDMVTITGSNIDNGATVKLGSVDAAQVTFVNATTLLVTTPAHYAGPKNIIVTNIDGQTAEIKNGFTYLGEPPTITSISPQAGSMVGGTTVTINGSGFESRRKRELTVVNETAAPISSANIFIQLNTGQLIAQGKMRTDGGDIRFYDASGSPLPYYLESGINTATTNLWTTIPNLPVGTTTIYMGYGTPAMTGESDSSILSGEFGTEPVTFALTGELYVAYPGVSRTVCKSWSPPGGGKIVSARVSHSTEGNYDYFSVSGDGTQYYRNSGSAVNTVVPIANQASALTACMQTDGSGSGGYGGQVTSVEALIRANTVTASVGIESMESNVQLGGQDATISQVTDTQITVTTSEHAPGLVDVVVGSPYSNLVTSLDAYTYLPADYAFTNTPLNAASAEAGELWIEARDANGSPVTSTDDITLELGTTSDAGYFAHSLSGENVWDKTTVTIPAGQTGVKVYYKDNLQGSPTITAADAAGTTGSQQQTIGPRYKLLVTGVSDPVQAGVPSSITIQATDAAGTPLADYTGTIQFTSTDPNAKLPSNHTITTDNRGRYTFVNGVTMMSEGEQCVSVVDAIYPSIAGSQCDINVLPAGEGTPSQLQIITPAQSFPLTERSSPITVQAQDVNNAPAMVIADLPVYFYSSSSTGQFSLDGTTWSNTPVSATIQSGTSSVNVYYRDSTAGSYTLTARDEQGTGSDTGWQNSEQAVTVGVGASAKLKLSGDENVTAGTWAPVQIGLGDVGDNSVNAKQDVPFHISSDSSTARFSTSPNGDNPLTSLSGAIMTGTQYETVYISDTTNHQLVLQASDTSPPDVALASGSLTMNIEPASPMRVAFMPVADTKIYEPVPAYAYLQDEFGNTVLPDSTTEIILTSSAATGGYAGTDKGPWTAPLRSEINVGQSNVLAYYRDTKKGTATLSASSDGLVAGQTDVQVLPQQYDRVDGGKLKFISAPAFITTDTVQALTVTLHDQYGEVATASSPVTILFSLTSGQYSIDGTSWTTNANVFIPSGESSATIYYRNQAVGSTTLYAEDTTAGSATRISHGLRVDAGAPAQLVYATEERVVAKGGVTDPISIQLKDAYDNDTVTKTPISSNISSSSPTGEFSLDGMSGWTQNLTVPYAPNATNQAVYYRDTTVGTHTLTSTSSGLTPATQSARVIEGFVDHIVVSAPASGAAGSAVPVTVSTHMTGGQEVAVIENTTVNLQAEGEFSLTESPFTPVSSVAFADGDSRKTLYYRSENVGANALRASEAPSRGWVDGDAEIGITAGAFYAYNFTAAPLTTPVTESSGEFVVSAADMYGNIALASETTQTYLYSDSDSGDFAPSPSGSWGVASVSIAAGTSSQSFFYKDTTLGTTATITASDASSLDNPDDGLRNATAQVTVVGQRAEKIGFTTASQTVVAGEFSGAITVQAQKSDGSPAVQGEPLSLDLAGDTGDRFFSAPNDESAIGAVVIPTGESTATFYIKPAKAGERDVTASKSEITGVQSITVLPGSANIVGFTSTQQNIVAGEASGQITLELRDAYGNSTNATSNTVVALSSSCGTGEFSLVGGTGWTSTDSVTIPAGEKTALFYYRATTAGWCTVTAGGGSLLSTDQEIYIRPSEGVKLHLNVPTSIAKGESVSVSVTLRDTFGNITTNKGSYRTVYFESSSREGSFEPAQAVMWSGWNTVTVNYTDLAVGTTTLTARDQASSTDTAWLDASSSTEVTRGEAQAVAFTEPTMNIVAGEPRQIRLELRNQYGAAYTADADTILYLSTSEPNGYFAAQADASRDAARTSVTLPAGQSGVDIYYIQTVVNTTQLSVSINADGSQPSTGITNGTASAYVMSAAIDGLYFSSQPMTGEVNEPRAVTVEPRDRYGNATSFSSDTILYFASTSSSGSFMQTSSGASVTSTIVPAGSSSATIYYKDQVVGNATLTVSDRSPASEPAGIADATQTVSTVAATPSKLVFFDAPRALERGQVSSKIRVEIQSRFDVSVPSTGDRTIYLTDSSQTGAFALSPGGPWTVSQLRITNGESGADVYYRNAGTTGNIQLVASDISTPEENPDYGLVNAQKSIDMQKGAFAQLRFESAPLTQTAKHPSGQIILKAYNRYGVETSVANPTQLSLRSSQSTGEFSTNSSLWGVNRVTLSPSAAASTVGFYYRDTQAGMPTITVSTSQDADPGAITATQQETILMQEHEGFIVTNISDPQHMGTPSSIVVAAIDYAGYTVDWYDGTIRFSSPDPEAVIPEPYTYVPVSDKGIHTFTNGVAFRSTGEKTIQVTDENGKTGGQDSITVLGAATTTLNKLAFIAPNSSYASQPNVSSPVMTIQAQDATGNAYVAGASGLPVQLRSSNANGQFATSPSGAWKSVLDVSIPSGLSFVNVYYRDTDGVRATLTAADWVGGNDNGAITNANFTVLGKDENPPDTDDPLTPTYPLTPGTQNPATSSDPGTPGDQTNQPNQEITTNQPMGGHMQTRSPQPSSTSGSLASLLPPALVQTLRSPAAPFIFPVVLFILIGLFILALLRQVYLEVRRVHDIRAMLAKEAQTAHDKNEFLTIAAHYLRTPITIIGSAAGMLGGAVGNEVVTARISQVSERLRQKSEEILMETEGHEKLQPIDLSKVSASKAGIYHTPLFWLPVILSVVFTLLINWVINEVGGEVSAIAYLEQVLFVSLGALVLYAVLRERYVGREKSELLESVATHRSELDQVKNEFVTRTYDALSVDVAQLIGLKNQLDLNQPVARALDDGSRRLLSLIAKFQTLAQIDSLKIHPSVFESEELIEIALGPLQKAADEKDVTIAATIPHVKMQQDERLVATVLQSVLANAIDFSPSGSKVAVVARQMKDTLVFTVADQGPGFSRDPAELLGLFERGESAQSVEHEGMGLSLYLNKIIMDNLGGTIDAKNNSEVGAQVTFSVPLTAGSK